MTATFFNTVRKVSLVLALTTSFAAVSSTASFAFSSEAQQQCTGDAFRLCSSEIPNIPKITACMIKHRADLSVGCRGVMDRELAVHEIRQARRAISGAVFNGSENACVDATQAFFRFRGVHKAGGRAISPFTNACGRDFGALDSRFDAFS